MQLLASKCPFTLEHPRDAWQYAHDVVTGEILAGHYVVASCQRFLDDLERDDIEFREAEVQKILSFYEELPHVKDYWAQKKMLFKLSPWQKFTEANIWGWYWADRDQRRFKEAFELIPRKNGKSFKVAARGAYAFAADGVAGTEIYSGATSEKQAWEVFGPLRLIFKNTEDLCDHFGIEVHAKHLSKTHDEAAKCMPIIGNPGDGSSPQMSIHDEYHEHKDDRQVATMSTGMGARAMYGSPLMCYISTAGDNLNGPCYEKQLEVQQILDGTIEDDTIFGIIYGIDEGDEWDSEEAMIKANPNLGVSVSMEYLKSELEKARRSGSKQAEYKTKHLNVWVGSRSPWMNMVFWHKQKAEITLDDFVGYPCFIAADLNTKKDLASLCLLFKSDDNYYAFNKFYAPESAVQDNPKYRDFVLKEEIVETPGNITDYSYIEDDLISFGKLFKVKGLVFDVWQANYLMTRLMNVGLDVIELPMTTKNLSEAMKEVEAQVLDGALWHNGDTCMTWQVSNVSSKPDARNNIYPRKQNENDKQCHIDGPVTLIMAMSRWISENESGGIDDFLSNPVSL